MAAYSRRSIVFCVYFRCSLCSYATDHEGALKRHVTSHHPNTAENQSLVLARDEGTAPLRMEDDDDDDDDGIEPEADDGLESDGFRLVLWFTVQSPQTHT